MQVRKWCKFLGMVFFLGTLGLGCQSPKGDEVVSWIQNKDIGRLEEWLEAGGDPNALDAAGASLLFHAAGVKKGGDLTKELLEHGADPNLGQGGTTPLMVAAGKLSMESAEWLLDAGADRNRQNTDGQTALDLVPSCMDCPKAIRMRNLVRAEQVRTFQCASGERVEVSFRADRIRVRWGQGENAVEFTAFLQVEGEERLFQGERYQVAIGKETCSIREKGQLVMGACPEL